MNISKISLLLQWLLFKKYFEAPSLVTSLFTEISSYCAYWPPILFSVFENNDDKTSLIYYRTKVEDGSSITTGQFYEFDSIPFELLADDASRIMLKRYIAERDLNAFGVFVGKESEGNVEAISKTNQNV